VSSPFEWLIDLELLRRFPQRYARAVDDREHDALAALFDPDGTVDGTRGTQAVPEYLESMRNLPRSFTSSMHLIADPLIDFEAGADSAHLDTYAVVFQTGPVSGEGGDLTLGMRYVDDMIRCDGVWRIHHRVATMLWMRT
jgi:SnoaL-like domain